MHSYTLSILAAGFLTIATGASLSAGLQPNIVFILADDMGWSDIGCYGSEIKTPNIDKLGLGGMRFTQMHNTSKCFPSRACLLTGVYAHDCGMAYGIGKFTNAVTLGEVLRPAGYRTLASGKHHCVENLYDRGFDRYFGLRDGACNFFNPGVQRQGEPVPAQKNPNGRVWCIDSETIKGYTPPDSKFYTTDAFTDYALGYLDEYKKTEKEEKPFFLYLSYNAPHDPLQAWPEDIAKYEGVYDVGYEAIRNARDRKQRAMGLIDDTYPQSAPSHPAWASLTEEDRADQARRMQVYAAMIDRLDQNIGRLLRKLEELGEDKNTLIFFASDNGASGENVQIGEGEIGSIDRWASLQGAWANVCNTPFRFAKNDSHEGGTCTPFIACWPGKIAPGSRSEFPCHFVDVMPTFIDITGADYPIEHNSQTLTPLRGMSLLPVLRGQATERTDPLFFQWAAGRAVRRGNWKLVAGKTKTWELYDVAKDKSETVDLASDHPEIVNELEVLYQDWIAKHPKPAKKKKE